LGAGDWEDRFSYLDTSPIAFFQYLANIHPSTDYLKSLPTRE